MERAFKIKNTHLCCVLIVLLLINTERREKEDIKGNNHFH